MTRNTFPLVNQPMAFIDNQGNPAANGKIYTYYAGSVNVAVTYTDSLGTANNPNPVLLDITGRAKIYGDANISYHVVGYDQNNVVILDTDNANFGTGLLVGAVLVQGEQTVVGRKIFSDVTAFGSGANTEYDTSLAQQVVGAQSSNVAMTEYVANKSANISATKTEGVLNGSLEYDLTTDTWNFRTAGVIRAVISNTAINFPTASSLTANGQTFLTNSSVVPIAQGGTGQITAPAALIALAPSLTGNSSNVLATDGTVIKWQSAGGAPQFLATPYQFFNGTSQGTWTSFNVAAAGVTVGARALIVEAHGDNFSGGPNIPGNMQVVCYRIDASHGNGSDPSTDTFILLAASDQNSSHVQGQGASQQSTVPLNANGQFQYIAQTYSGYAWQQLQLRIVGWFA